MLILHTFLLFIPSKNGEWSNGIAYTLAIQLTISSSIYNIHFYWFIALASFIGVHNGTCALFRSLWHLGCLFLFSFFLLSYRKRNNSAFHSPSLPFSLPFSGSLFAFHYLNAPFPLSSLSLSLSIFFSLSPPLHAQRFLSFIFPLCLWHRLSIQRPCEWRTYHTTSTLLFQNIVSMYVCLAWQERRRLMVVK